MIWIFFIACIGREKEKNIALCDQASEGFHEYLTEIREKQEYQTCQTEYDCTRSWCRSMCGYACVKVLSNEESSSVIKEKLDAYEAEHCQACANYPYPEPDYPYPEPVAEPPWCTDGICD